MDGFTEVRPAGKANGADDRVGKSGQLTVDGYPEHAAQANSNQPPSELGACGLVDHRNVHAETPGDFTIVDDTAFPETSSSGQGSADPGRRTSATQSCHEARSKHRLALGKNLVADLLRDFFLHAAQVELAAFAVAQDALGTAAVATVG
jgi:hypothetical protein